MKSTVLLICLAAAVGLIAVMESKSDERSKDVTPSKPERSGKFVGKEAGQVRDDNAFKLKFVWCPSGKFIMGSSKSENYRSRNSEDQVEVTLSNGFWLGQTEVTQGQWQKVTGTTPWKSATGFRRGRLENGKIVPGPVMNLAPDVIEGPDYAATMLTWDEALEFCKVLTRQEREAGRLPKEWEYRLPTDAQWEYACRAGTSTTYSFGDDKSLLDDYAWWGGKDGHGNAETEQYAHRVGLKQANPWGLHDVHGNVEEWCNDWDWRNSHDTKTPGGTDPAGPESGKYRIARGGSWAHDAGFDRSASRMGLDPPHRSSQVGFRVAAVLSVQDKK